MLVCDLVHLKSDDGMPMRYPCVRKGFPSGPYVACSSESCSLETHASYGNIANSSVVVTEGPAPESARTFRTASATSIEK